MKLPQLINSLVLLFIFSSCHTEDNLKNKKNNILIGTLSYEVGEPNFNKTVEENVNNQIIETHKIDELIIINKWETVNICGTYEPGIKMIHDTIYLKYDLQNNNQELCKSQRIDKITYIIDNRIKKKWTFIY